VVLSGFTKTPSHVAVLQVTNHSNLLRSFLCHQPPPRPPQSPRPLPPPPPICSTPSAGCSHSRERISADERWIRSSQRPAAAIAGQKATNPGSAQRRQQNSTSSKPRAESLIYRAGEEMDYLLLPPLQGSARERQSECLRTLQGTDICNVGKRCDDTATNATKMCCKNMRLLSARRFASVPLHQTTPTSKALRQGSQAASSARLWLPLGRTATLGASARPDCARGGTRKKACRYFRYLPGINTHWSSALMLKGAEHTSLI